MSSPQEEMQRCLINARFEVLPLRGAATQAGQLPRGTTVPVTASPSKGVDATVDLAAELSATGLNAVPHLAARLVADVEHLSALLDKMENAGIHEVFVIAGDSPIPVGAFPDALSILRAMDDLGRRPSRVGITGYAERHAFISDAAAIRAMTDKADYADYIVSQICYSPQTILSWLSAVRDRGVQLPIYVGAPGAVDVTKLLRISMRIGLGESVRFLRKQYAVVSKLLTRYTPDRLFDELSPYLLDPSYGIAGWHLFTFNEISKTVRWRDDLSARMYEVPA